MAKLFGTAGGPGNDPAPTPQQMPGQTPEPTLGQPLGPEQAKSCLNHPLPRQT